MTYCKQCLEKQQKINELGEEVVRLKRGIRGGRGGDERLGTVVKANGGGSTGIAVFW